MNTLFTIRKRFDLSLLVLFVACLLLSLLYCPPVDLFYDDKEIFKYAGMLIYRGGVPYRDLFDHKPPLIFFLNFFGHVLGPWGLWLIDTFLVTFTSLFFFSICKLYRLHFPWLLPLLFNLLIRNYMAYGGIGMTRGYTAIFLLLFFCVLLSKRRYSYAWLGVLAALIFFMQQDQVLPLLPLLVYALLSPPTALPRSAPVGYLSRTIQFFFGLIIITAPILIYFGMHQALINFWEDAFVFNFSWYTEKRPFIDHYHSIKSGLQITGYEMPVVVALTLGCSALILRNKKKKLVAVSIASLLFSFCAEYLSGKLEAGQAFYYYFLPLSATVPILVFTVFAFAGENFLADKKGQLLLGFLLCILPLYNALQHATHLSLRNRDVVEGFPEFEYLRQHPPADHQLYVFGDNNWVYAYNYFGILAPSHWVYHHFWGWYQGWDADHRQLTGIENDLQQFQTRYIIDYSNRLTWRDPAARDSWTAFLHKYYRPVAMPGSASSLLWQRLDTPLGP